MAGSWSKGFKSRPSTGAGKSRANGFDVSSMKSKNPVLIIAITDSTRAIISLGKWLLKSVTATIHSVRKNVQSSRDPSCDPHVAARRYCSGSCEFEFVATFSTEKSFEMNE